MKFRVFTTPPQTIFDLRQRILLEFDELARNKFIRIVVKALIVVSTLRIVGIT